ncbi:MAG: DUF4129 domain-containing protein [Chloroflexota bacterium]
MGTSHIQRLRGLLTLGHAVPLLAVFLEVLWIYAWFAWIGTLGTISWPTTPIGLEGAVALAMAAEATTRLVLAYEWPLRWTRVVALPAMAVFLVALVRIEMGGGYALWDAQWFQYASLHISPLVGSLAFGVYLLWRGMSIGRETLSFEDLYPKFLVGLVALVVLFVLWRCSPGVNESGAALGSTELYVVAYFSTGLVGLALLKLVAIRQEALRHEDASAPPSRLWLTLTLGVVLAILAVGIGVGSIFSLDLLNLWLHPLNILAQWIVVALFISVVYLVGFPAAGLIYILHFLVSIFGLAQPPQRPNPLEPFEVREKVEGQGIELLPPEAVLILKGVLVALVVVLVVYLLARTLFRYRRGRVVDEGVEQISESLWSWKEISSDLLSLLIRLLRWLMLFKGERSKASPPPAAAMVDDEDDDRIFPVRELYQGLLWEGTRTGFPRQPAATPYEYQRTLEHRLPAPATELEAITHAYVAERYGSTQLEAEQLVSLNRLWRRLRAMLRREQHTG